MAEYADRENFIPFRKADVVDMCLRDGKLDGAEAQGFREFCKILESLFHFEFHERLERLKDAYAPFDPDSDTRAIREYSSAELEEKKKALVAALDEVLTKGNYERVGQEELDRAMEEESLFKIRLGVDFDDFDEVIFFSRGEVTNRETLKKLFGLKKEEIDVPTFERVAVYVKFKDEAYFTSKKRKNLAFKPGSTILKLFRNIPKADIEMLFPNCEVRMKPLDKALIGVPALAGGIPVLLKIAGSIGILVGTIAYYLGFREQAPSGAELTAVVTGLAILGGYLFKQWTKFKNRKIQFMKMLGDNLYFKNLDNNSGVFHHLIDNAEEEECKEAFLGYYHLLTAPEGRTEEQLDDAIEQWFEARWQTQLDFEVDDALHKLERLGLATREGEVWRAVPLDAAKERLDFIWDNYFDYNGAAPVESL